MKVLVTGGAGFIGSNIILQLLKEKTISKIICFDNYAIYLQSINNNFNDFRNLRFINKFSKKIIFERGESNNAFVVNNIIKKYQPSYIFHLAALPLAKIDNLNFSEAGNGSVESTKILIESVHQNLKNDNFKRFIYCSSSMVYGNFLNDEINENHPTNPIEIYGLAKLIGETITKGLCNFYNLDFSIVRPSAVYGPTDMNRRVIQTFIEKAINKEQIVIRGKNEILDFSYVEDVARGFIKAAFEKNASKQTYNITNGKGRKLIDVIKILKKYFKDIDYIIADRDKFRPKRGTLSISKAVKQLKYKPKVNLEIGIDKTINFYKKNNLL